MTEWRHRGAMSEYMSAGNPRMLCRECRLPWPCDTRVVLDVLDRQADLSGEALTGMGRAEAHAKALAEALRSVVDVHSTVLLRTTHPHCCQYVDEHGPDCKVGRALDAYDKDHER